MREGSDESHDSVVDMLLGLNTVAMCYEFEATALRVVS